MLTKLALSLPSWVARTCSARVFVCGVSALALSSVSAACADTPAPNHKLLSTQGLYSDIAARRPVAEALQFEPDYPLWSDGVQKRRWLILPQGARIDTSDMDHWEFPVGTKLFKEFALYGQLLETRLVERIADTGKAAKDYKLATFVWRKDQSDALETTDGVQDVLGTDHNVPEQKACMDCHHGEPGRVLGVSALQLSRSGLLADLAKRGRLSVDPKRTFEIPGDEVAAAAAGYMHANCGHCHSTDGQAPSSLHMRLSIHELDNPLEQSELYETTIHQPISEWKDHPEEFRERVVPGDPERSAVYYRMKQRGDETPSDDQMPPLATEKVHLEGVAAVKAWIELLHDAPDSSTSEPHTDDSAQPGSKDAGPDMPREPAAEGGKPKPENQSTKPESPSTKPPAMSDAPAATSGSTPNMGDVPSEPSNSGGAGAPAPVAPAANGGAGASGAAGAPAPGANPENPPPAAPPPPTGGGSTSAGAGTGGPNAAGMGGAGGSQPPGAGQAAAGSGGAPAPNPAEGSAGTSGAGGAGGAGGSADSASDEDCAGSGGSTEVPETPDGDGDSDEGEGRGHAGHPAPAPSN